ncbi:hypothetical protein AIOL_001883 [Candidatus Rhodobacter oscarellae]|uniref:Uncharacterized protein n=1 Tax=Candidatus Rhodobacter oscarellae TaxID=1675527 RepID=A0A0J9E2G8_9RHOB|nr:hypothetical protein [Candidatus Rhodobacter lobularis]KMW56925.1 hypothetical protein AIOL_001883 [Candidatus Rhodobacter lobularis]
MRLNTCLAALALSLSTLPAWSQSYICSGQAPNWRVEFDAVQGRFSFPAPTDMDVMLVTTAEGAADGWPRAFTLIGERDTAIVLIEQEACGAQPLRAHVMTQRGQTPILLTGCCTAAAE